VSRPTVTHDADRGGGFALIRIPGEAALAQDPRFRLTRYDGAEHFGPDGWRSGEATLRPDGAFADGADLVLEVGPELVDRLEDDVLVLELVASGAPKVLVWPGDLPQSPPGSTRSGLVPPRRPVAAAVAPVAAAPVEVAEPPPPAPPPEPPPPKLEPLEPLVPPAPPPVQRGWLLPLLILLLLVAGGGGAWWFLSGGEERSAPTPAPQAEPAPAAAPAPTPPAADAFDPARASVADAVRRARSPAELVEFAEAMRQAGRHDDWLLLQERAAEQGHVPAMRALARLFDPVGFTAGPLFQRPDPRQAARYWRDAQQAGDAAAAAPREALRAWLEERRASGDVEARLVLEDFWQ
jgi:hypothetical protein